MSECPGHTRFGIALRENAQVGPVVAFHDLDTHHTFLALPLAQAGRVAAAIMNALDIAQKPVGPERDEEFRRIIGEGGLG